MTGSDPAPATLVDIPLTGALPVEHLCDFSIEFEPAQSFLTPRGRRMVYVIKRGVVSGPRLRGEFLPGGGDWIVIGQNRVATLDVRATLRTHDGELVFVTNTGRVRLDPDTGKRFWAGEMLRWDEIYARSAPLFETGSEPYAWLNSTVTVAINEFSLSRVNYRIYAVR